MGVLGVLVAVLVFDLPTMVGTSSTPAPARSWPR
jgi:hypothetical protein